MTNDLAIGMQPDKTCRHVDFTWTKLENVQPGRCWLSGKSASGFNGNSLHWTVAAMQVFNNPSKAKLGICACSPSESLYAIHDVDGLFPAYYWALSEVCKWQSDTLQWHPMVFRLLKSFAQPTTGPWFAED